MATPETAAAWLDKGVQLLTLEAARAGGPLDYLLNEISDRYAQGTILDCVAQAAVLYCSSQEFEASADRDTCPEIAFVQGSLVAWRLLSHFLNPESQTELISRLKVMYVNDEFNPEGLTKAEIIKRNSDQGYRAATQYHDLFKEWKKGLYFDATEVPSFEAGFGFVMGYGLEIESRQRYIDNEFRKMTERF